jgi:hypothetical protein
MSCCIISASVAASRTWPSRHREPGEGGLARHVEAPKPTWRSNADPLPVAGSSHARRIRGLNRLPRAGPQPARDRRVRVPTTPSIVKSPLSRARQSSEGGDAVSVRREGLTQTDPGTTTRPVEAVPSRSGGVDRLAGRQPAALLRLRALPASPRLAMAVRIRSARRAPKRVSCPSRSRTAITAVTGSRRGGDDRRSHDAETARVVDFTRSERCGGRRGPVGSDGAHRSTIRSKGKNHDGVDNADAGP